MKSILTLLLLLPILCWSKVQHMDLDKGVIIDPSNDYHEFFLNSDSSLEISFEHEYNAFDGDQFWAYGGFAVKIGKIWDMQAYDKKALIDTTLNRDWEGLVYSNLAQFSVNDHLLGSNFYLGFVARNDSTEKLHCGWVRASLNAQGTSLTILEIAYDDEPNVPVVTGLKSALVLAESIDIKSKSNSFSITKIGQTIELEAELKPANVSVDDASWKVISGIEFGYINSRQEVIAKGNGEVVIQATTVDGSNLSKSVTIKISGQPNSVADVLAQNFEIETIGSNIKLSSSSNELLYYTIYGINGVQIKTGNFRNETVFSSHNFNQRLILVSVTNGDERLMKKIMLAH